MYRERLNPRIDFAFKKIFGSEENKDLLKALLNAILPKEDQVKSLTLKNPYTLKSRDTDKSSILDIRAVGKDGVQFNIEMQVADELGYEKRALYLWSEVYKEQLKAGESYKQLKRTISIHILNFTLMKEENYHNHYAILNKKSKKEAFTDLQLHTIELNKFESAHGYTHVRTSLDRWSTFLTRADELANGPLPKALQKDKAIVRALQVLQTTVLTDEEYQTYRNHIAWLRMEQSAIEAAEAKAEAKGKAETEAAMVIKMNHAGMPARDIVRITGFLEAKIQQILADRG